MSNFIRRVVSGWRVRARFAFVTGWGLIPLVAASFMAEEPQLACGGEQTAAAPIALTVSAEEATSAAAGHASAVSQGTDTAQRASVRVVRGIPYVRHGEQALYADLYLPSQEPPYPCVLMIHGGAWMAGNRNHAAWRARQLAAVGIAAVTIDYRLAPHHLFPAQLDDCRAALAWIGAQAGWGWDPHRVAAYGYSAGGHLACLLAMTREQAPAAAALPRLTAVVAGGAPCEFRDLDPTSRKLAFWLGGSRAEKPDSYVAASPTQFVTPEAPPVFLFHGARDRVVALREPRQMQTALQDAGVESHLHVVANAGHWDAYIDDEAFRRSLAFLQKQFASQPKESSGER